MKNKLIGLCFAVAALAAHGATKPNVVFILADDLGYGDVHVLNPERCKIDTPSIDELAEQGMIFTDAHTSSSVCTPTRYGIITGRYNWRSRLQKGVLFGFDQPLIPTDRLTVAGFLREQGYATACIGKWHLGMTMPTTDGKPTHGKTASTVDWKGQIKVGPYDVGFDYYYGIAASLDMPPYIYIENNRFDGEATAIKEFHPNREGPAEPDFEAVEVLDVISKKSAEYIGKQTKDKPFFMYIALTSPHTPIVPSPEWQGKSELGSYGDFVMQTDAIIGQIVDAIDAAGLAENTMIVVTADNGCSAKPSNASELEKKGHYPSAQYRGYKSDLWEGGHRVPFIVRWPSTVKDGTVSDQTICLTDLMATCADLTGSKLPSTAGEDSVSFAPALEGKPIVSTRKGVIHHSINGQFAYREGKWKLLFTGGGGGWTKGKSTGPIQLYDMEADPSEKKNLYQAQPEVVERLLAQAQSDIDRGRSTDGPDLKNDVKVKFTPNIGK
jgi:arylsulfatase A-like enzyme